MQATMRIPRVPAQNRDRAVHCTYRKAHRIARARRITSDIPSPQYTQYESMTQATQTVVTAVDDLHALSVNKTFGAPATARPEQHPQLVRLWDQKWILSPNEQ